MDNNQLCTSNTSNTKGRKSVWFQNKSINKINFNLKFKGKFVEKELDYGSEESKIEKKTVLKIQLGKIQQNRKRE